MATTEELLISINETKTDIKEAIEATGVTVGAAPFDEYPAKIAQITRPAYVFNRPSEWPVIENDIGPTDQKFVGLFQVANSAAETCGVSATTSSGTYTVDWGDGTTSAGTASDVVLFHTYSYADSDLTSTSYGYKIAKVTITPDSGNLTRLWTARRAGDGNNDGAGASITNTLASAPWLDIDIRGQYLTVISLRFFDTFNSNTIENLVQKVRIRSCAAAVNFANMLNLVYVQEYVTTHATPNNVSLFSGCGNLEAVGGTINLGSSTNSTNMFLNCINLKYLPAINYSALVTLTSMFSGCSSLIQLPATLDLSSATNTGQMFNGCSSLIQLPATLDLSSVTNTGQMFNGCRALTALPATLNLSSATVTISMFNGCKKLVSIPPLNLAAVTTMASMFNDCTSLITIGAITPPSISTAPSTSSVNNCYSLLFAPANFHYYAAGGSMLFTNTPSLRGFVSPTWGTLFSISILNCNLSATALNALYTSLPTVTSKTITVTGNPGVATDTPSIATAKGWTVTG